MIVLVVDDEDMILQLAKKILNRAGHEVLLSASGEQSLAMYSQASDRIDLVLLDLKLGDMSGYQILKKMRAINPSLPCIFSSGNCPKIKNIPEELRPKTLVLEKPYRASQLADMVNQTLS